MTQDIHEEGGDTVKAVGEVALEETLASVNPRETIVPPSFASTIAHVQAEPPSGAHDLEPLAARIELGTTLGQGGMAVVRVARQKSLGREVAVKMMRGENAELASTGMLREAWITGALEHPNIVPVHDLGVDDAGRPMLVLKRIEGKPWSELVGQRSLEWNLQQLLQVCNAVAFAHSRGIVHRDLKPANIMIGGFGEVNVLDWGIAVSLVDDGRGRLPLATQCTEIAGTLAYMAPEMLGTGSVTAQTDVYLLGAILVEVATGRPPHLSGAIETTIASIRASQPTLGDDVPSEIAAICRRAMAKEPSERFATAEAFRDAIVAFLEHRSSSVLAEQAHAQLRELEVHLATRSDSTEHRARTYELFGEVRFGFQAALRAWTDNTLARDRLERALVAMANYELDHGDARAAAVLIADVRETSSELRERLATVERHAQDRTKRLERFEADSDVEQDSSLRTAFIVVCGIVWTCIPLGAAAFELDVSHLMSLSVSVVAVFSVLIFGIVTRVPMMSTTWNRGVYLIALLGLALQAVLEAAVWAAGFPLLMTHIVTAALWAGTVGVAAVFLDRALFVAAIGFVCSCAAMVLDRRLDFWALGFGVIVLLGTVLYIHLWQKRGRPIAGIVDILRPEKS